MGKFLSHPVLLRSNAISSGKPVGKADETTNSSEVEAMGYRRGDERRFWEGCV